MTRMPAAADTIAAVPVSERGGAWQRFRRDRAAMLSFAVLAVLAAACFASIPWTAPAMRATHLDAAHQPPSLGQPLGTDALGRSLLARTLYGGAISLSLGLLAATIAVVLGTAYGAVAGFVGGRIDGFMMRCVDVLYAMPYVLLVMLLTVSLGAWLEAVGLLDRELARFVVLAVAIGGVSWLTTARVVRGQVLLLREQPFLLAARSQGIPPVRILARHVLPNLVGLVVVFATLTVPQAILQESFLSFLGVGVQPPQATWGSLAADGVRQLNPIEFDWWLVAFPSLALVVTLLALNFMGEGLRSAFEMRARP